MLVNRNPGKDDKPDKIVKDTLKKLLDEKNLSSTEEILCEYEEKVANKKIKLEERVLDLGVYIKFNPDWAEKYLHESIPNLKDPSSTLKSIFKDTLYQPRIFIAKVNELSELISSSFNPKYERQLETMLNSFAIDIYIQCLMQNDEAI